jgi:small conductance mechanosensitive channel
MSIIDEYDQCSPDQAVSCRVAWKWTGNEKVSDLAEWVIGKPLAILLLIVLGLIARWLIFRVIDRAVAGIAAGPLSERRALRARTMGSLLKSIVTGVVFTIILMMVIDEAGYPVAPLLASAGILGVAIGFGAQSLVKDFLSGFFMLVEDQYGVGDIVDLGEASGTVEAVTLRVTRLRDVNGTVWHVPNGAITRVGNKSQQWARALLDVNVVYGTDVDEAERLIKATADALWNDPEWGDTIIEEPEVWGVEQLAAESIHIRLVVKTQPSQQFKVTRELRRRLLQAFEANGIEVPTGRVVIRDST